MREIEHHPFDVYLAGGAWPRGIEVVHLAVTTDRGGLLGLGDNGQKEQDDGSGDETDGSWPAAHHGSLDDIYYQLRIVLI